MTNWTIKEIGGDEREWPKENYGEVEEALEQFDWMDLEVITPTGETLTRQEFLDGQTNGKESKDDAPTGETTSKDKKADTGESGEDIEGRMAEGYQQVDETKAIDALAQNPIDWLQSKNSDYTNTVKGTPAISKRGFRYIQSQFSISTTSEVVKFLDDPLGVIIWARAELPDGRKAEAHGEGYQFESGVDDNEFVRYADTRAKNRALADLTSSGALATEEMEG